MHSLPRVLECLELLGMAGERQCLFGWGILLTKHVLGKVLGIDFLLLWFEKRGSDLSAVRFLCSLVIWKDCWLVLLLVLC